MKPRTGTITVALAAAAFALFSRCDLPPSFGPEYYDSSTNYIAAYPLALSPAATDLGTGTELGAPGVWDWAWRGNMDNTYSYMTLTDAGEARPGGGQAWILELANLFTNGTYEALLGPGQYIDNPPSVSVTTVPDRKSVV